MITCRELIDFLMDYLDGDLPEARRAEFEKHLKVCPPCVRYLASYTRTVELGKQAFERSEQPVAPDVPDGLVKAVLAARKTQG